MSTSGSRGNPRSSRARKRHVALSSPSPAYTGKLAARLARKLSKERTHYGRDARVVGLVGPLGAGKTTFIQGFGRALGVRRMPSPTFLIVRRYPLRRGRYQNLFHVDAYRVRRARDLAPIGLPEVFKNPKNLVIVEWADRIRRALPRRTHWVKMEHGSSALKRTIRFTPS